MKSIHIKIALFLNYFIFAILLNSVGTVILNVQQNFDISKAHASTLEGFKDLPIAICSFLVASFLPRIGIKKSMLIALGLVAIMCAIMPFTGTFWIFKLLFAVVGVSFALIKISVYTSVKLVTTSEKEHASFMGFLEGFFMVGVLLGNILFSLFINDQDPHSLSWLHVYWVLATLSVISFVFLLFSKFDETGVKVAKNTFRDDVVNSAKLLSVRKVLFFIACAFLFVLVEQSYQTWTPTFFKDILKVPTSMSIQAGAVLAGAFALGRFSSGFISRRIKWIYVISFCILGFVTSILLVIPLTHNISVQNDITWLNAPAVIYLFPLMGLFLSPIYPSINSVILSAIPKFLQSSMSGLIVIFSAIGGTIGSMITGFVFQKFSGQTAFYMSLIPLSILMVFVLLMYKTKFNFK